MFARNALSYVRAHGPRRPRAPREEQKCGLTVRRWQSERRRSCIALGALASVRAAQAVLPPGNTVAQWDKIAEDTVVGSGAFQNEGLVYMAYVSDAMYRSITPGRRLGQSPDAAVIESAYTVSPTTSRPSRRTSTVSTTRRSADSRTARRRSSACGTARTVGRRHDRRAGGRRAGDADRLDVDRSRRTTPGPGVWRLTPAALRAPQTPWVGQVRPFVLRPPTSSCRRRRPRSRAAPG